METRGRGRGVLLGSGMIGAVHLWDTVENCCVTLSRATLGHSHLDLWDTLVAHSWKVSKTKVKREVSSERVQAALPSSFAIPAPQNHIRRRPSEKTGLALHSSDSAPSIFVTRNCVLYLRSRTNVRMSTFFHPEADIGGGLAFSALVYKACNKLCSHVQRFLSYSHILLPNQRL